MGRDKGLLSYHGQPQRRWLATLLAQSCARVFVSVRAGQAPKHSADDDIAYIEDSPAFENRGPMGALLSANELHPNCAWLVVSCDLPYFDGAALECLLKHRDMSAAATAFVNPEIHRPEPLVTIYEALFMRELPGEVARGGSSMMRILHALPNVRLIRGYDPRWIISADTPGAFDEARRMLATASGSPTGR